MLLTMSKVEIVGVKTLFFQVLETLQDLGTLHLEDITKKRGPRYADLIPMEMDPALEEERNLLQNLAMRNNAILSELAPPKERISSAVIDEKYGSFQGRTLADISAMVEEEESATRELISYKNELEVEMSRLSKYEPIIKKVYPLASKVTTTEQYTSVALLIEERYKQVLDYIEQELERITSGQCDVFSARVDENTHAAILVFHKRYSEQVHNFLAAENVNQVRLPTELADKPYDEAMALAREIAAKNPHAVRAAKKLLNEGWHGDAARGLLMESELEMTLITTPNQLEAITANFAKRAPVFQDPD